MSDFPLDLDSKILISIFFRRKWGFELDTFMFWAASRPPSKDIFVFKRQKERYILKHTHTHTQTHTQTRTHTNEATRANTLRDRHMH
jgi:hypothetical protein